MSASYLIRKQEEIPRAVAWLEDLLRTLPEGLNSQIMEDGSNLSGGQRQRVAIARALLRDDRENKYWVVGQDGKVLGPAPDEKSAVSFAKTFNTSSNIITVEEYKKRFGRDLVW